MNQPLPLFVTFHAEPNGLYVDINDNSPWSGFEKAFETTEQLREEGLSPNLKFVWLIRADHQIEILHGESAWGLREYQQQINRFVERGDDIGIHVHPYKYLESEKRWVQDFSDEEWMKSCISKAFESFETVTGKQPQSMSIGPNSTSIDVINHSRELGIRYDFTISHNGKKKFNQRPGEIRGEMQWYKNLPPYPYVPSMTDLSKEDRTRDDYYLIPVHYFMMKHGTLNIKGTLNKYLYGKTEYRKVKPSLSMPPAIFQSILEQALKEGKEYLLIDTRTHIFLQEAQLESIKANLKYLSKWQGKKYDVMLPSSGQLDQLKSRSMVQA